MSADVTGLIDQLRSTLGRMEVALGAIADAIVWTGSDGRVQWCNAAFDRLVTCPHILILNAKLSDLLPLMQAGQPVAPENYPDAKILRGNGEADEYEFEQEQAQRYLEISGNCIDLPDGTSAVLVIRDITAAKQLEVERQRTEAALQQSEQRFRVLVNNIPGVVYHRASRSNRALDFVSDAITDVYGYSPSEYLHPPIRRLIDACHPDDRSRADQEFDLAVAAQQPYNLEYRIIRADGEIRWVNECGQATRNDRGEILGCNGLVFDITHRKIVEAERERAEVALKQSEQRFRTLVNNIPGVVYRCACDREWTMEFLGGTVEEITGYPIHEFINNQTRSWASIIHPEDRQLMEDLVAEAIAVRKPYVIEFRIIDANGVIHWLYEKGQGYFADDGTLLWLDGAIFDISERKQTEEALQRSEQKYRTIFQNSQFGIGRTRLEDGFFIDANQRLAEILGVATAAELIGQDGRRFYANPAERKHILAELQKHGDIRNFEMQLRRADGALIWALLSVTVSEQSHVDLIMTDISDRKRLEEELQQSQQFLDSIIENIPLGVFVKDIRNDFRYVLLNEVSEKVLGFSRERAIGRNDQELIPLERADFYDQEDQLAVEEGMTLDRPKELLGTNSDGSVITRTWKRPLLDHQGNPTYLLCIAEDITERNKAEVALRRSEARFRALYESTSIAVFIKENGIPVDCNRAAEILFRGSRQELMDNYPNNFWPPLQPNGQDSDSLAEQHIALAHEHGSHRFEWVYRRLDGTEFPAEVQLTVFEVEGRRLVQSVVQDLSERKQAEAILQRRAQESSILSQISRQLIDQDIDLGINQALQIMGEFTNSDRSYVFRFYDNQQRLDNTHEWCAAGIQPFIEQSQQCSVQDHPWSCQKLLSGEILNISDVDSLPAAAIADQLEWQQQLIQSLLVIPMQYAGKVVGCLGLDSVQIQRRWCQDDVNLLRRVGELIAIAQARHKAEEKFIKAFRASPSPITITTLSESRFIDVNPSFLRMSGYSLEEVIDHTAEELNMRLDADGFNTILQQALQTGSVQNQEVEFRTKSGAIRTLLLSIELIDLSGSPCRLNIINDITERKRLENELISLVSHELRTPMTSLLGALDLLGSGQLGMLTTQGQQVLSIATNNTERLTRLVNDILDLERMRSGKIAMQKVTCNMAELMTQAIQAMQAMADKAQVTLVAEPLAIHCCVDPDRLLQTFTNLLSNAIKFSPPDSKIWLSAQLEPRCLHITVQDQGRGIPADKLQMIFDRFQQVDASDSRQKGGTGLGLAICRNIVEQHGGKIWAESRLGSGSTFHITLPLDQLHSQLP